MKGITPVIAVILLLLITISMVGFSMVFFQRTAETATRSGDEQLAQQLTQFASQPRIESVAGDNISIRNAGSVPLSLSSLVFLADGESKTPSGGLATLQPGQISTYTLAGFNAEAASVIKVSSGGFSDTMTEQPRSCKGIMAVGRSAGSGVYMIYSGDDALSVYCDMTTDGGGWTKVWQPASTNEAFTTQTYFTGTESLVANAKDMMMAFTTSSNSLSQSWKFNIPNLLRSNNPVGLPCNSDTVTATRISDGLQVTDTLIWGTGSFGSQCSDGCSGTWGRTCLRRSGYAGAYDFPFYATYSVTNPDHCSNSDQGYSTTPCSNERLFVIYVR
ncbi:MAG: hypothetical protein QT00_C0001G0344 [archaeon GW2011_AR5]|nr:MAG: hypothetical protein QT00_C0001G0344 [archaeon GW2011_AR5]